MLNNTIMKPASARSWAVSTCCNESFLAKGLLADHQKAHMGEQLTEMAGLAQEELLELSRRSRRAGWRQQRKLPKGAEPLTSGGDVDRGGIGWKGGCGSRVNW